MHDEPPAEVEDELPVEAPAEEPPVEVEVGDVVEVEDVVLVVALAPPFADVLVGVGVCGLVVCELVVECVFDPVVVEVGLGVGVAEEEVFQFVVNVVVVFPVLLVPWTETGGVTVTLAVAVGVGVVLAEVLEVLCVLEVPPLTEGSTLIIGWTRIAGATVMVALFAALIVIARAWPRRLTVACSCPLEAWWPVG